MGSRSLPPGSRLLTAATAPAARPRATAATLASVEGLDRSGGVLRFLATDAYKARGGPDGSASAKSKTRPETYGTIGLLRSIVLPSPPIISVGASLDCWHTYSKSSVPFSHRRLKPVFHGAVKEPGSSRTAS